MKCKLLVFMVFTFLSQNVFSQYYVNKEWEKSYQKGIDTLRWGSSCTFDSSGYLVVGGSSKQSNGSSGIFLNVIRPSGDVVWSRLYHHTTTGNDFAVKVATSINDGPDGYFVVGTSYSNSTNGYDIVLLQYRGSGTLVWEYRLANPGNDYPTDLKVDNSGNAYITGVKRSGSNDNIVTIKVNYNGTQQWVKSYGNSYNDISSSLILDHSNNVYVVGGVGTSATNRETVILKYNADLGTLLGSVVGSTSAVSQDISTGITLDINSDIIVCSTISDNGANYYWRTAKYNHSTLSPQWSATFMGDNIYNEARLIRADASNNIIVAGIMNDSFGDKALTVLKYNSSGTLQWKSVYVSDTLFEQTIPWAIDLNNNDDIFIACSQVAGSDSSILVLRYSNSGGCISWLRKVRDDNLKGGKATDIKISKNNKVYVMGTARTLNGDTLKYLTSQYTDYHLKNIKHLNSNGISDYMAHQVVVNFKVQALNTERINKYDIEYGRSLITTAALNTIQNKLGYSIENIYKVCPEFTQADSLSIARNGDLVHVPDIYGLLLLTIPDDKNVIAATDSINTLNTLITSAELNRVYKFDGPPNDPKYPKQASLHITSSFSNADINAEDAWSLTSGTIYTKVAVIDDGVDWARKDFRSGPYSDTLFAHSKVIGYDFDHNQSIGNDSGWYSGWHGTAVAGIIGANRNNNYLISGIAGGSNLNSGVSIVSLKSDGFTDTRLIRAIYDAAYHPKGQANIHTKDQVYGVDVINMCLGFGDWGIWQSDDSDIYPRNPYPVSLYDAIGFAVNNGVTIICSRGNTIYNWDSSSHYPASLPKNDWIISVGASETDGTRKSFDNITDLLKNGDTFGVASLYGRKMDLIAPGTASLVLTLQSSADTVFAFTNTSAAAPHVAGTAALIADYSKRTLHDTLSPETIQALIKLGATDKGAPGYDPYNGFGLLNAGKSVNFLSGNYKIVHYTIKNVNQHFKFKELYRPYRNTTVSKTHKINSTDSVVARQCYYFSTYEVTSTRMLTPPSGYKYIAAWGIGSKSDALDWLDSMYIETNTNMVGVGMAPTVINTEHGYAQVYYFNHDTVKLKGFMYFCLKPVDSILHYINAFASKNWKDTGNSTFQMSFDVLAVSLTVIPRIESNQLPLDIYPNPAQNSITLQYTIPQKENVSIALYDLTGRKVADVIPLNVVSAGTYKVKYNSENLSPGAYFFRLQAGSQTVTEKFIKMRP